jgi:cytochrome c-type biogenesis protein CcmH/NrfF
MNFDFLPTCMWTQCLPAFLLGVGVTFLWGTALAARERKRTTTRSADQIRKIQKNRREGN